MSLKPLFEVTNIKSMEWNRTINNISGVADQIKTAPVELSKEAIEQVRQALRANLKN